MGQVIFVRSPQGAERSLRLGRLCRSGPTGPGERGLGAVASEGLKLWAGRRGWGHAVASQQRKLNSRSFQQVIGRDLGQPPAVLLSAPRDRKVPLGQGWDSGLERQQTLGFTEGLVDLRCPESSMSQVALTMPLAPHQPPFPFLKAWWAGRGTGFGAQRTGFEIRSVCCQLCGLGQVSFLPASDLPCRT